MNFPDSGPILACSTSTGSNAAIAVLRFSGFESLDSFKNFLNIDVSKIKPRFAHLTDIVEEQRQSLDQALFLFFPGPKSFTGENCAELHIHGNLINIQNLIELFTKNGAFRLADPGEFTYRALINKKLNLTQVEGLDLMLNANSTLMLQKGLDILHGDLYRQYRQLYENFLKIKMALEMNVDFAEDIGEQEAQVMFDKACDKFEESIKFLHSKTQSSTKSLLSPSIVLVGGTNAGKSSLFNSLLNESRAIVSPVAGTTRDFISEYLFIKGTNYKLIDTAGIRITKDKIEEEGIKRAIATLKSAFYKILVINPFIYDPKDYQLDEIEFDLILITHADCEGFFEKIKDFKLPVSAKSLLFTGVGESGPIGPGKNGPIGPGKSGPIGPKKSGPIGPEKSGPIGPKKSGPIGPKKSGPIGPKKSGPIGPDSELADLGQRVGTLIGSAVAESICNEISSKYQNLLKDDPIPIERHCNSVNKIYLSWNDFKTITDKGSDFGILSSEINILEAQVSELIGITSPETVLNEIFSNFCIGK